MMFTRFLLALLVAVCGPAAWAQSIVVNTYDAYLASEVTDDRFVGRWYSGSFHFERVVVPKTRERKDAARRDQEHRNPEDEHVGVPYRFNDRAWL